jgi:Protein of unknown function (DUF4232)
MATAAGCGGHERVIPWVARPATTVPFPRYVPRAPAGAPPCHDLRYAGTQGVNSVTDEYGLAVRNSGSQTCSLEGRPAIVVPPGGPGPLSVIAAERDATVPPGFPAQGARFGLRPGQEAHVTLLVVRPCDHQRGSDARQGLRAFLPIGDAQTSFTILTCRGQGAVMSVGVFAPPERRRKLRTWPLRASLALPSAVRPGRTFSYRVHITNVSQRPFRFPYCPTFAARLNGGDRFGTLNCEPMGTLAPGAHATFAMQRFVTRKLPAGRYELRWSLMDETLKFDVVARGSLSVRH